MGVKVILILQIKLRNMKWLSQDQTISGWGMWPWPPGIFPKDSCSPLLHVLRLLLFYLSHVESDRHSL